MIRRQGSLFWSLTLISVGVLFLLSNLNIGIRPWSIVARYWPVLIIFWGLGKLVHYIRSAEDPAVGRKSLLTAGDVALLIFLLILGTAVTKAVTRDFWGWHGKVWDGQSGEDEFDPFIEPGEIYTFTTESSQALTQADRAIEIINKYGSVNLSAHNLPEVRINMEKKVKAKDKADAGELADKLKILIERKPQGYVISSNRDDLDEEERNDIQTDLSIRVPKSIALTVSNSYGAVALDGVAGSHNVENGYGPVAVRNVDGNLRVENKSGAVNISGVTGDCNINTKYGATSLDTIGGKAQIEHGYGLLVLNKVKGSIQVMDKYGEVDCRDLESSLSVDGRYVEVRGINIGGDVKITTSYRNIDLENVQGAVNVQAKHGDVKIKGIQAPSKPITIDSEYSAVNITLPEDSHFQVDAYSKYGRFISGFASIGGGKSSEFYENSRVRGVTGEGGPSITIKTSYRDIYLNAL
jgi:DUF4097 and DUF4098 domain-containing protein YvlB